MISESELVSIGLRAGGAVLGIIVFYWVRCIILGKNV
jgi:hypothetical protein